MSALLGTAPITHRTATRPAGSRLRFNGATTTPGQEVACRWETTSSTLVVTIGQPSGRNAVEMKTRAVSVYTKVRSAAGGRPTRTRKVARSPLSRLGDAATDIVVSGPIRERHLVYRTGVVIVELDVTNVSAKAPVPSMDALAAVGASLLERLERIETPASPSTVAPPPGSTVANSAATAAASTSTPVPSTAPVGVATTVPSSVVISTANTPTTTGVTATPKSNLSIIAVELQFEDPSPGGQAVWIANGGTTDADLSCMVIRSLASGVKATIGAGTPLAGGRVLRVATPTGMLRTVDTVTLTDRSGHELDRTPQLTDQAVDDRFWFRDDGTWRFGRTVYAGRVSDGRLTTATPPGC